MAKEMRGNALLLDAERLRRGITELVMNIRAISTGDGAPGSLFSQLDQVLRAGRVLIQYEDVSDSELEVILQDAIRNAFERERD